MDILSTVHIFSPENRVRYTFLSALHLLSIPTGVPKAHEIIFKNCLDRPYDLPG
jgi:hypothetical protein